MKSLAKSFLILMICLVGFAMIPASQLLLQQNSLFVHTACADEGCDQSQTNVWWLGMSICMFYSDQLAADENDCFYWTVANPGSMPYELYMIFTEHYTFWEENWCYMGWPPMPYPNWPWGGTY